MYCIVWNSIVLYCITIKLYLVVFGVSAFYRPDLSCLCCLGLREECRLRVFENRILRRIFKSKRDVNGDWRGLHNEELHSLYRSPNIVRVIKSRRLRWAGRVARRENAHHLKNFIRIK